MGSPTGSPEPPQAKADTLRRRPGATEAARKLRLNGTKPEALLWLELKANRLGGYHFVRQLPIGRYVADFACRKERLIVEVDGWQHAGSRRDIRRDAFLRQAGWSVMRIWNEDVIRRRADVCATILAALRGHFVGDVAASDLRFASKKTKDAA